MSFVFGVERASDPFLSEIDVDVYQWEIIGPREYKNSMGSHYEITLSGSVNEAVCKHDIK
jgi:hypothetical protein